MRARVAASDYRVEFPIDFEVGSQLLVDWP
jgi:hypothetical protein